jgi:hypothetical protein
MINPTDKPYYLGVYDLRLLVSRLRTSEASIFSSAYDSVVTDQATQFNGPKPVAVFLSADQVSSVHDQLLDLLSTDGVGQDGELNTFGLEIERLLDVFNAYEE